MKHKMWSRLLSMALAVMMIASIVPNSAFAEAASELAASSQVVTEMVEGTEEVTQAEETTGEEPAEQPAGETASDEEPVAEPSTEPAVESEQPTTEPTQAPAETAVPSEQPSAEPSAAPEGTQTPEGTEAPEGTAVPSETPAASATPAPSESPVPSETPAPTETPEATEEPVAMNEEAYEATAQVENADITVTVKVPEGALPVDAELKADLIAEETEEFAQAQAALDEQQVEYDGMIALDIRFEVNGEEIEPLFPVEVTIDAKAMLPEDADPETVAVQHLEENENGEVTAVKTVADATKETGDVMVEETQTEEAAMDMASTFAVDGFSRFTITWSNIWGSRKSLNITCYYDDETPLPDNVKPNWKGTLSSGVTVYLNASNSDLKIDGYTLVGAKGYVDDYWNSGWKNISSIKAEFSWGSWSFTANDNLSIKGTEGIKLYYKKNEPLEVIPGVQPEGVTVNLFNYNTDYVFNQYDSDWSKAGLIFSGGSNKEGTYNNWTGDDGKVYQGIVEKKLTNGFPVKANNRQSLNQLFTGDGTTVRAYENVKNLFQQDGSYYYYNSDKNFAELTTSENGEYNFKLYAGTNSDKFGAAEAPKFLPFNSFAYGVVEESSFTQLRQGADNKVDYHFGMSIDFSFAQPANGKVNNQDMVFEFTGDDDVWLFIDDVLVLDMGGIHNKATGTVNFSTGEIKITHSGTNGKDPAESIITTLDQCFRNAGYSEEELNDLFVRGEDGNYRFRDYTTHSFRYFYLERGAGGSNCQIRFNLPTIPTNDLVVAKKVTQTGSNEVIDENTVFSFVLKNGENPVNGRDYVIYDLDAYTQDPKNPGEEQGSGTTSSEGIFKIKAGQVAVFKDIINTGSADVYTVSEQLTETLEDNISAVYIDGVASADRTTTLTATDRYTLFDNWVTDKGEYQLSLTKQWKNQNGNTLAAAAIPFTEVHVTVEQYYKIGDGNQATVVNSDELVLTVDNQWKDSYSQKVENYTAFRVREEEIYINNELIVTYTYDANGKSNVEWTNDEYRTRYSEWNIGDFEFIRNYTATGTQFTVITPNANKKIPVPTNGCVIICNSNDAVIWTPYLETMSETAKKVLLTAIEGSDFDSDWGNNKKYYFMDDPNLPGNLSGAKDAIESLDYSQEIVEITFDGSSEWNKVAYGAIALASTEISASLTNTLNTGVTIDIPAQKKWEDGAGNKIAAGAESITVQLLKDGQYVSGKTLTLDAENNWEDSFRNLAKYNSDGTLIAYTVEEEEVPGYTSDITGDMQTGFTITNTPSEGYLKIHKDIVDNKLLGDGKDVFSFRIEAISGTDRDKVWYMHVNGTGDAYYAIDSEGNKLTDLKLNAGEYTVTELENINYQLVNVDSTDTDAQIVGHSITVIVGGNETTTVTFTNSAKAPGMTDGSGVINKFREDSGTITFDKIWIAHDEDEQDLLQQDETQ